MWQQYRRTLIPVQVLIVIVCALAIIAFKMPAGAAIVGFALPMELAAFLGAMWSARLKRKIEASQSGMGLRKDL